MTRRPVEEDAGARAVTHASFTIERTYNAPPSRVFEAFADPAAKMRWLAGPPEWGTSEHHQDFRVGGREIDRAGPKGGPIHAFEGYYHDIVPDRRIVFAYDLKVDGKRMSVSLVTVELAPAGAGTHLVFTEQAAFFEGFQDGAADRERGTRDLLDALGREVEREPARSTR